MPPSPPEARRRRRVATLAMGAAYRPGGHEAATLEALARRIAALMDAEFVGECAPHGIGDDTYLVPESTLVQPRARRLGIRDASDLFGGVVPHAFVATKLVSHPAYDREAPVPEGWSRDLPGRLADTVLPGFSVFDRGHALDAFDDLSRLGRVRFKLARGIGGSGQHLVDQRRQLQAVLDDLPPGELAMHGASLEQDLREATTFSIGVAECAGIAIAYHGRQRTTRGPHGDAAYGGSDLDVARGGLDALVEAVASTADPDDPAQADLLRALRQVQRYDAEMLRAFPGFFASRRNYDVVAGLDADGQRRSGVLEQSWRIGGASPAELLAMEAFAADPALERVRAACYEVHGACTPPPDAVVHYRGEDPRLGALTKYAVRVPLDAGTTATTATEVHGHAA